MASDGKALVQVMAALGAGALGVTALVALRSGAAGSSSSSSSSVRRSATASAPAAVPKSHARDHLRVFVSGAAGQIAYSLLPLIASGAVFGPKTEITLQLLDISNAMPVLAGVVMELEDGAYPLLRGVIITDDAEQALRGVDVAVFLGGFPRKQGMERKDLISVNCKIFSDQGKALDKVAPKHVKVLVVANPANTNCYILRKNAPSIPAENFTCLTRLDYNRAVAQIAAKAGVRVDDVTNVTIWGNHSSTQYPDAASALVRVRGSQQQPATAVINDDDWLKTSFLTTVQQRGKAIIDARKMSSAMSAANAIADHLRTWLVTGTEPGVTVPMGVISDGSYQVEKGLVFSFPLYIDSPGTYRIAQGFKLDDFAKSKLALTQDELRGERAEAEDSLRAQQ